jgi:predicted metal-dependent enzyme (double-stranded beta helix superfamily)
VHLHDHLRQFDLDLDPALGHGPAVPAATLRALTSRLAAAPALWRPIVRHDPDRRWYTRLLLTGVVELWLIGWAPGQRTRPHDHGGAAGALTVAEGALHEVAFVPGAGDRHRPRWRASARTHATGAAVGFGPAHVHLVANQTAAAATSIHAYSPPLLPMNFPDVGRAWTELGTEPAGVLA